MKKNIVSDTWRTLPTWSKGIIVIVGGYVAYRGGKKLINYLNQPPPPKLPQGGAGLPVVSYGSDGKPVYWNPRPFSKNLYEVMDGLFTFSGTKDEAFSKFGDLPTNDMVVSVYNDFNSNYGDGETLTAWIKGEWFYDITGAGRELALNRLQTLQLP